MFIIVHHSRFLLVTVLLINLLFQKYYYHHTRYYLYQNRHHHCHNTVEKKYMYSQVENVAFTGEMSVGRIRGLRTAWEGDTEKKKYNEHENIPKNFIINNNCTE